MSIHPVHWVEDDLARRDIVNEFFSTIPSQARRIEIIKRYCVSYILLHIERSKDNMSYYDFSKEIYRNEEFILLEVNKGLKSNACMPV